MCGGTLHDTVRVNTTSALFYTLLKHSNKKHNFFNLELELRISTFYDTSIFDDSNSIPGEEEQKPAIVGCANSVVLCTSIDECRFLFSLQY